MLDDTGTLLAASLETLGRRHTLLATNLANAQTPGYLRADLDFAAALRAAVEAAQDPAARERWNDRSAGEPFMVVDGSPTDLEMEMAEVARNSLHMMTVTTLLGLKLEHLRLAISEGRR
ncbi:MAG: hypothetical protein HY660_03400 [Armatimonadetes bacterium]|nr:hypothetical protein [Armatimonadota bacterium]